MWILGFALDLETQCEEKMMQSCHTDQTVNCAGVLPSVAHAEGRLEFMEEHHRTECPKVELYVNF